MIAHCLATIPLVLIALPGRAGQPALNGHCPVCLVAHARLVPGKATYASSFDRQVYYFPSAREKAIFDASPETYAPALGGDCVVCRSLMGVRMPGKVDFFLVHKKRAFLFPSPKERDAFKADPSKYESSDLGLDGYCSVCAVMANTWVEGNPRIVSVYDGIRYFFPSQEEKKAFDADPARFVPALDGHCVVCLKDTGKHIAGMVRFSALYKGRLYLFPDEGAQKVFLGDAVRYQDVDVANHGNCIVCAKMAKKTVPGSRAYVSIYKGMRYFFPSSKERAIFDADPASFASPNAAASPSPTAINVTGKTACAACAYGVRPLADSSSLGIAVVNGDSIYIVEEGEARYPHLFRARFDGLTVQLRGTEKKRDGKFVWVEPTELLESK